MPEDQPLSAPIAAPSPQTSQVEPGLVKSEPSLSQVERIVDTFTAPRKTFADIRRSASWWAPFLVALALGMAFALTAIHQIGYAKLADGVIAQNPSLQNRIDSGTPEQAALIHVSVEAQFKYIVYFTPAIVLLVAVLCAGILLATVNFGLGGEAKFGQMLAVWFYGTLPLTIISLLAIIAIFAGLGTDSFNMQNPMGTNIGYYIPSDSPAWLKHLLDSADIFSIWSACLLTIGVSIVGKVKRGAAAAAVFGWWIVYIVVLKIALPSVTGS